MIHVVWDPRVLKTIHFSLNYSRALWGLTQNTSVPRAAQCVFTLPGLSVASPRGSPELKVCVTHDTWRHFKVSFCNGELGHSYMIICCKFKFFFFLSLETPKKSWQMAPRIRKSWSFTAVLCQMLATSRGYDAEIAVGAPQRPCIVKQKRPPECKAHHVRRCVRVSNVSISSEPCTMRSKCSIWEVLLVCLCALVAINIAACSGFQPWDSFPLIRASPSSLPCGEVRVVGLTYPLHIPMATPDWVAAQWEC